MVSKPAGTRRLTSLAGLLGSLYHFSHRKVQGQLDPVISMRENLMSDDTKRR